MSQKKKMMCLICKEVLDVDVEQAHILINHLNEKHSKKELDEKSARGSYKEQFKDGDKFTQSSRSSGESGRTAVVPPISKQKEVRVKEEKHEPGSSSPSKKSDTEYTTDTTGTLSNVKVEPVEEKPRRKSNQSRSRKGNRQRTPKGGDTDSVSETSSIDKKLARQPQRIESPPRKESPRRRANSKSRPRQKGKYASPSKSVASRSSLKRESPRRRANSKSRPRQKGKYASPTKSEASRSSLKRDRKPPESNMDTGSSGHSGGKHKEPYVNVKEETVSRSITPEREQRNIKQAKNEEQKLKLRSPPPPAVAPRMIPVKDEPKGARANDKIDQKVDNKMENDRKPPKRTSHHRDESPPQSEKGHKKRYSPAREGGKCYCPENPGKPPGSPSIESCSRSTCSSLKHKVEKQKGNKSGRHRNEKPRCSCNSMAK